MVAVYPLRSLQSFHPHDLTILKHNHHCTVVFFVFHFVITQLIVILIFKYILEILDSLHRGVYDKN